MRVDTIADASLVTVLRPLDDERSLQLGGVLDDVCDSGADAVLDLRLASAPPFVAWLVIERCRKRFARAGTSLRLITGAAGYSDERRAAQHCLGQLRTGGANGAPA